MRKLLLITSAAALLITGHVMAGHNNPWADSTDDLLMQYHEENLEQSEDTPGEDEMLGVMVQNARGKLDMLLSGDLSIGGSNRLDGGSGSSFGGMTGSSGQGSGKGGPSR